MGSILSEKMIYIGQYEEISPNKGYPSMRDYMVSNKYAGQDRIVRYLKHGSIEATAAGGAKPDVFTGEAINVERGIQTDGNYAWSTVLPYYVEKYNLVLPKEFANYILNRS